MGKETEICLKNYLVDMYCNLCSMYRKVPADICTIEDSITMDKMYRIICDLQLEHKVEKKLGV